MYHFLSKQFLAVALLLFVVVTSCDDAKHTKPGHGQVTFSLDLNSTSQGRVAQEPHALIVTVVDKNNIPVLNKKKITLYSFNGSFISEPLDLKSGTYKLTEFFVLDENNNIVYATPLEGSPLAYLVNDPLPM